MTEHRERAALVLAAGEGKRLRSTRPKVLHSAAGRSLLGHVLAALRPLNLDRIVVVTSARLDEVREHLSREGLSEGVTFAVQRTPRGTADATRVGLKALGDFEGEVLVAPGDAPLLTSDTLVRLLEMQARAQTAATLLTASVDDPEGYGRVVRGEGGVVDRIVEHCDAAGDELRVREVNSGVYVFEAARLARMLGKVGRDNAQGEEYLTDVVGLLRAEGELVRALETNPIEVAGVNDRAQLADAARHLRGRACRRWLERGVSIIDPATTFIDPTVEIEADAIVHPFTFLEGTTVVGAGAEVGPQTRIVDSRVGPGAKVTFAVVHQSSLDEGSSVGPFASLRPGTHLGPGARLGTFVETKNAALGRGAKANHLAYLGDAEVGSDVNIGAGTITCNWDGVRKHRTVIEDEAYISSDTMLVAPVRIGRRAATGAGAVVRGEVPPEALAVGVPARIIEGKGNRMKKQKDANSSGAPREAPEDPRQ